MKTPRQLQTLFSICRCDRSESVGKYPRKLDNVLNPSCRLCDSCEESIYHLTSDCSGAFGCRQKHNLSAKTLVNDSPFSTLKTSEFDTWLRGCLKHDTRPPEHRIKQGISLVKKRGFADVMEEDVVGTSKRTNFLVVPEKSNPIADIVISSKVIKIE